MTSNFRDTSPLRTVPTKSKVMSVQFVQEKKILARSIGNKNWGNHAFFSPFIASPFLHTQLLLESFFAGKQTQPLQTIPSVSLAISYMYKKFLQCQTAFSSSFLNRR